jgi:hypothetical protein
MTCSLSEVWCATGTPGAGQCSALGVPCPCRVPIATFEYGDAGARVVCRLRDARAGRPHPRLALHSAHALNLLGRGLNRESVDADGRVVSHVTDETTNRGLWHHDRAIMTARAS